MVKNLYSLFCFLSIISITTSCSTSKSSIKNTKPDSSVESQNKNDYTTIYFVRHAEKDNDGTSDPGLSSEGLERANNLTDLLKNKGISKIYSTPYNRTKHTVLPLSSSINVPIDIYDPRDPNAINKIIQSNTGKHILVVGHSNTVPMMINTLAKENKVQMISENEYDNIFEVHYTEDYFNLNSSKY